MDRSNGGRRAIGDRLILPVTSDIPLRFYLVDTYTAPVYIEDMETRTNPEDTMSNPTNNLTESQRRNLELLKVHGKVTY